uniref:Methionine adenosyltransferase 2 subunit beta n=1 Tax=Phocoena sinus TaxID=42100 RepID=A0A8C9C223_PHOSS
MVGREKELSIHFVPGNCRLVEEEVNIPNRRVLITGATGLLGRAVYKEFQQNNWHAVGCGFRRARPKFEQVNLLDLMQFITSFMIFQVWFILTHKLTINNCLDDFEKCSCFQGSYCT